MTKDLIILALIGLAGWYAYVYFEAPVKRMLGLAPPPPTVRLLPEQFQCDRRKYCSQMTSCEEVRYFLAYCPNTNLDGDLGGIPCEKRWCK